MNIQRRESEVLIAVSGHRVLQDEAGVMRGISEALGQILQCWDAEKLCILTSLADGADRLAVRAAGAAGPSRSIAVLPMDAEAYRRDFSQNSMKEFIKLMEEADSVEVLNDTHSREEAYYQAGAALVEACDVLLAVWDGEEARGRGGTGDIVQLARQQNRPVAWVHAPRSASLSDETVYVGYERFPEGRNCQE